MKEHTQATFACWFRYNKLDSFSEKLILWWQRDIGEMSIQGDNTAVSDNVYYGDMEESQCQDKEVLVRSPLTPPGSVGSPLSDQKTNIAEKEQALITMVDIKAKLGEILSKIKWQEDQWKMQWDQLRL